MLRWRLFCFANVVDLFSALNILGRLVDPRQILTHVRRSPEFVKLGQKFGDLPPPKKNGGIKRQNLGQISDNFMIW